MINSFAYTLGGGGTQPKVTTDADAADYISRMGLVNKTLTADEESAVHELFIDLKASGIYSKIYDAAILVWNDAGANMVTLKGVSSPTIPAGMTDISPDGMMSTAGTQYINTGIVPADSLVLNDTHMALYSQTAAATSTTTSFDMGCRNSTSQEMALIMRRSNGAQYSIAYSEASTQGYLYNTLATSGAGLFISSRPSANTHFFGRNGNAEMSQTTTTGSLPTYPIFVMGSNLVGSISTTRVRDRMYAFYSVGGGISVDLFGTYHRILEAFFDKLKGYDEDARYYFNRLYADGRLVPTQAEKAQINTYILDLKAAGVWDKIYDRTLMFWSNAKANLVSLKGRTPKPTVYGVMTHNNLGMTAATNILSYLDLNFKPSDVLSVDDTHMSMYVTVDPANNRAEFEIGARSNNTSSMALACRYSLSSYYYESYNTTNNAGRITGPVSGSTLGYHIANRDSAASFKVLKNDIILGAVATAPGGTIPNLDMFLFSINLNGTPHTVTSTKTISLWSVGQSMTDSELTEDKLATEKLMDARGIGGAI